MKGLFLKDTIKDTIKNRGLFILAVPGLLFLLAFNYLPMIGIIIPFKDINYSKGIFSSPWSGLKNFQFLFTSGDFIRITRNAVGLNALFIISTMVISIILALMLFELTAKSVKVFQTFLFMPYFLSWVVVGYIVYAFLNPDLGVVNSILKELKIDSINWFFVPNYWPLILTASFVWKNVGYFTLLFYTGLMSLDISHFEAAAIDGASKLQQIFNISIPMLKKLIVMLTLLQIGRIFFSDFGLFYFVTQDSGSIYSTTDVIDTYVYRTLRVSGDIGMAGAAGLYQSVVGLFLVIVTNKIVKKVSKEDALF